MYTEGILRPVRDRRLWTGAATPGACRAARSSRGDAENNLRRNAPHTHTHTHNSHLIIPASPLGYLVLGDTKKPDSGQGWCCCCYCFSTPSPIFGANIGVTRIRHKISEGSIIQLDFWQLYRHNLALEPMHFHILPNFFVYCIFWLKSRDIY